MSVLDRLHAGDIRALSRVISYVENRGEGYADLLAQVYKSAGHSLRVGITGPPGAGKSTLVNGLISEFLRSDDRIGVIAVDPTSPFTGGALLGDRVRINDFPSTGRVYFRSMATRGASGGLTAATKDVTLIYDAFGFDVTLIETVGVGQVELDIVDACDAVVVVVVPESGDAVQTMKAGLMEIADVFCVNKADRSGADRIEHELRQAMDTRRREEGAWAIPVISTVATDRTNLDQLFSKVNEYIEFIKANGRFVQHRREQIKKRILNVIENQFWQEFHSRLRKEAELDALVDRIYRGETNPFVEGERLFQALGKP